MGLKFVFPTAESTELSPKSFNLDEVEFVDQGTLVQIGSKVRQTLEHQKLLVQVKNTSKGS